MARFIAASNKPPVSVPAKFMRILDRAIKLREKVGLAISDPGNASSPRESNEQASDLRHSYFISILQAVREALRPCMSRGVTQVPDTPPSLANVLSSLTVDDGEDFSDDPEVSASAPPPPATDHDEAKYTVDLANDFQEAMVAFTCLLTDLDAIRALVHETWEGYEAGKFNLVNAAVTSNTALQLARHLEEEQCSILARHGGGPMMLEKYYAAHSLSQGFAVDFKEHPQSEVPG